MGDEVIRVDVAVYAILWRSDDNVGRRTIRRPNWGDYRDIAVIKIGARKVIEMPLASRFQSRNPRAVFIRECDGIAWQASPLSTRHQRHRDSQRQNDDDTPQP